MNVLVERTRRKYRVAREFAGYTIFDIGDLLKNLASEGLIWTLKDTNDLSEAESILIGYYLNEFRESQVYDFPNLIPSCSQDGL